MKTVILCIGNPEGGDDAVGPYIAHQLISYQSENYIIINAETIPENYTGILKKHNPDQLIIIDAVDMGLPPGSLRKIPKDRIGSMHISTHGIPLSVFISYVSQYINNITLLGIQPKVMEGQMSNEIKKTADKLQILLLKQDVETIPFL
jgi:hydrogenase 3 maturation protease